MSDPRRLLEQQAGRFPRATDAWDQVQRRLRGRQRRRRLGAASLALVVAATGAFGAYRAFTPRRTVLPGTQESQAFHALWPEDNFTEASEGQDRVDSGEEAWRADPDEVARRFGSDVLALPDPVTQECSPSSASPANAEAVFCPIFPKDSDFATRFVTSEGIPGWVQVDMARLVRAGEGGIWSVVKVSSATISLDGREPGEEVAVPGDFVAKTSLPDDAGALDSAYSWHSDCKRGGFNGVPAAAEGGQIRIALNLREYCGLSSFLPPIPDMSDLPPLSTPADGIVQIYREDADEHICCGLLGGRALRDVVRRNPSPPVIDVAMLPVRFVPAQSDEASPTSSVSPEQPSQAWFAIWPEHYELAARSIQTAVSEGDPELQWRRDPVEVVSRFASTVMRRTIVGDIEFEPGHDGDIPARFTDELGHEHVVHIAQRIEQGEGGIWSITGIPNSKTLSISALAVGHDHDSIHGTAPPGAHLLVSFAYGNSDDEPTFEFSVTADEHGAFFADLRTAYGDVLPIPELTGRVWVGVRAIEPRFGLTEIVGLPLPNGSYSF